MPIEEGESSEANGNEEKIGKSILSSDFEIANLNDALAIVEDITKMNKKELMVDAKHGEYLFAQFQFQLPFYAHINIKKKVIPRKFLEIIVSSPVFYNLNFIPKNKAIYQSHFKKFQFTDTEKM